MRFCDICQNFLYPHVDAESSSIQLVCKNCNYKTTKTSNTHSLPVVAKRYDNTSEESPLDENCIIKTNYFDDIRSFQQYQTKNIKYDNTLPRVNNIECPRQCIKNTDKDNEVICIRYDQPNMKYLYFCCHCEYIFKLKQ